MIGLRLEEDVVNELSVKAQRENKTVTQIVLEKLDHSAQYGMLEQQYQELKREMQELQRITKKQVPKTKRISIGFTLDQYESIENLAYQEHLSKSQLLHRFLTKSRIIPELE